LECEDREQQYAVLGKLSEAQGLKYVYYGPWANWHHNGTIVKTKKSKKKEKKKKSKRVAS
jgi:hypothetical protein